jgi:hypothetical protein
VLPQRSGLERQIVPQEEAAYRLLTKHFDSSILNHMDVRKHLNDELFDLTFEAIDELFCHANSNDIAKASHDIQNIRMRSSETLIEFFNRFEDALRNHVILYGRERVETGLGQKFIYPPRAFVEDNCCVEDKNKKCILTMNRPSSLIPRRNPTSATPLLAFLSTSLL